eukprot:5950-Heterococcus_DN1.PRE.2
MSTRDGAQVTEAPVSQQRTAETLQSASPLGDDDRVSKKLEFKELIRIALPIVVTMICQQGMVVTDQVKYQHTYQHKFFRHSGVPP